MAILPAVGTAARPTRATARTPGDRWVPWLVAAVAALGYSLFALTQWRLLEVPSWDLGIFTQLAKAYSRLEAPIAPIKGANFHLLGDHFHPILVVLGPLYRLFPSGLTLLVVQALLLAVSAVPITGVARELLGRGRGTVLGLSYALSWGLQGAVAVQFHEVAFAVPLLAFALAAFLRGRWWPCAMWAAPLVFVKEDLGLTVVALGLVLLWRAPRRSPGPGAFLTAWGAAWFVLAIWVVLPALNPRGTWDYYDQVGTGDQLLDVLRGALVPSQKYVTLLLLVAAAGVVGVRSPLVWLWAPTLAWRFLGDVDFYWGWTWHYSAVLMPVAAAALVDAVTARAHDGAARPARPGGWATVGVALAVATTALMTPSQPLARLVQPATYALAERYDGARAAVDAVTPGSTVEADIYLAAYLVPRATVYWVGNEGNPVPDVVLLDTLRRTWPDRDVTDAAAFAERRHPGTSYDLVLDEDGYQVARRVAGP